MVDSYVFEPSCLYFSKVLFLNKFRGAERGKYYLSYDKFTKTKWALVQ